MFIDRVRCGFVGVLAALLVLLALAPPGSAAPTNKPYSLTIAPGPTTYETPGNGQVAGGETVQITATFKNESGTQQMGSANLFWPSGFAVQSSGLSTTAGSASLSGSCTNGGAATAPCVQLRGMSAAPGASVTVTMWTSTPACEAGGAFAWSAEVKQANNFSGAGNDLSFDASNSQLNSTLDGACSLQFVTQPADARVDQAISDQPFNPPPTGGPVTVEVLGSSGQVLTGSTVPVSIGLNSNPGLATLGGTTTRPASGGTASFADLTLGEPGDPYSLAASSGTLTTATSSNFAIQDQAQFCSSGICTTTAGTSNGNQAMVRATVHSTPGTLTESVNANAKAPLVCAGYKSRDPNNYSFNAPSAWSKVVTITIAPGSKFRDPKRVLNKQQICFEAPYEFTTSSGRPATPTTFPDGTPGFIGLLRDCGRGVSGPCHNRQADKVVLRRHLTRRRHHRHHEKRAYNFILVADIPAGEPGDPRCG
jgi:hypothetical protein